MFEYAPIVASTLSKFPFSIKSSFRNLPGVATALGQIEMDFSLYIGRTLRLYSYAKRGVYYHLMEGSLLRQFYEVCVSNYPDPLDIEARSFALIPKYFLAGLFDYSFITIASFICAAISTLFLKSTGEVMHQFLNADMKGMLLLLSFTIRVWNFELGNLKQSCGLRSFLWNEMWKLNILILISCPALCWHLSCELLIIMFSPNQTQSWLYSFPCLLGTGNWFVASLCSSNIHQLTRNNVSVEPVATTTSILNETLIRSLKSLAMITLVKGLNHVVLSFAIATVIATQNLSESKIVRLSSSSQKISGTIFVRQWITANNVVTAKRDILIYTMFRLFWKGKLLFDDNVSRYLVMLLRLTARVFDSKRNQWSPLRLSPTTCSSLIDMIQNLGLRSSFGQHPMGCKSVANIGSKGTQIRLLVVYPSMTNSEMVCCHIYSYTLSTAPSYTAISYVWGSNKRVADIFLDGKKYKTTVSAKEALRGVRSTWREQRFWIDAICIDQDNPEDKAEQLSIMAEIYRKASEVKVWLGHDKECRLALSLARRLWIYSRLKEPYLSDASEYSWEALRRLLSNPWFQRSWVVQEVLSDNVIIQYGGKTAKWNTLSMIFREIWHNQHYLSKLYLMTDPRFEDLTLGQNDIKLTYILIIEDFRSMSFDENDHEQLSLLFYLARMFRSSKPFKASEIKDRVYALVNLCGLEKHPKFRTDYLPSNSKQFTVVDLFTVAARHHLSSGPEKHRLEILAHAGLSYGSGKQSDKGFPSWVPDWSLDKVSLTPLIGQSGMSELVHHPRCRGLLNHLSRIRSYDETDFDLNSEREAIRADLDSKIKTLIEKTLYRAAGRTLPSIRFHQSPNEYLELGGIHLDRLRMIGIPFPSRVDKARPTTQAIYLETQTQTAICLIDWYTKYMLATIDITQLSAEPSKLLQSLNTFARILLTDVSQHFLDTTFTAIPIRPAPDYIIENFKFYYTTLMTYLTHQLDLPNFLTGDDHVNINRFNLTDTHIRYVCSGRVLGVTEKGYLGLFPEGTKEGDEVCLFFGADFPYVLRDTGETATIDQVVPWTTKPTDDEQPRVASMGFQENETTSIKQVYELVGVAYVHGFMDGEGMTEDSLHQSFLLK